MMHGVLLHRAQHRLWAKLGSVVALGMKLGSATAKLMTRMRTCGKLRVKIVKANDFHTCDCTLHVCH